MNRANPFPDWVSVSYQQSVPVSSTEVGSPYLGSSYLGGGGQQGNPGAPGSIGTTPDWTSDPNPAAAGAYDMTPVRSDGDFNPLNRGPIGAPFFDAPGAQQPDNPNTSSEFSQGAIGQSLEW